MTEPIIDKNPPIIVADDHEGIRKDFEAFRASMETPMNVCY